jgi:hypothetical protein
MDPVQEARDAVKKTEDEIKCVKNQLMQPGLPVWKEQALMGRLPGLEQQLAEDKKRLNRVEEAASGAVWWYAWSYVWVVCISGYLDVVCSHPLPTRSHVHPVVMCCAPTHFSPAHMCILL